MKYVGIIILVQSNGGLAVLRKYNFQLNVPI